MWPDISRRIWLYVISKLGIFTNVDPSQLQLSATKLQLSQLEVDRDRFTVPGLSIQKFVIGHIELELGVTGLYFHAQDVQIELTIDEFESPDLAISVLMEATRNGLNAEIPASDLPIPAGNSADVGGVENLKAAAPASSSTASSSSSSIASKLADVALAQISACVREITIDVHINPQTTLNIHTEQAILSSKHKLELESISVGFSEEEQMLQSVYFDSASTLMGVPQLAYIDRVVVDFSLDVMTFSVAVDHIRVAGLLVLKLVIMLLNDYGSGPEYDTSAGGSSEQTAQATGDLSINCLHVYENLDGSGMPLEMLDIKFSQGSLSIEVLDVPEIAHVSPFFGLCKKDNNGATEFEAEIKVPLSANIPLEALGTLHVLVDSVSLLVAELELESDRDTTSFRLSLPEIRVGVGNGLAVLLVFPQTLSQTAFSIRECLFTAGDGQVLIEGLQLNTPQQSDAPAAERYEQSQSSHCAQLEVKSVKTKFTQELQTAVRRIQQAYFEGDSKLQQDNTPNLGKKLSEPPIWNGIELPNLSVVVHELSIDSALGKLDFIVRCAMSHPVTSLKVKASGELMAGSQLAFEFQAVSRDGLRTVDSAFLINEMLLNADALISALLLADHPEIDSAASSPHPTTSLPSRLPPRPLSPSSIPDPPTLTSPLLLPQINCALKFGKDLVIIIAGRKTLLSVDTSQLSIANGQLALAVPRLVWGIEDVEFVRLLKAKNIHYETGAPQMQQRLHISRCVLSTCADSLRYIIDAITTLTPPVPEPEYQLDLGSYDVDVFADVDREYFVPENIGLLHRSSTVKGQSQHPDAEKEEDTVHNEVDVAQLDIHDDYIGASTATVHKDTEPSHDANGNFEFVLKQFQWHVHDGLDFEELRCRARSASDSEEISDGDGDGEGSGSGEDESLTDSMFITPRMTPPSNKQQNESQQKRHRKKPQGKQKPERKKREGIHDEHEHLQEFRKPGPNHNNSNNNNTSSSDRMHHEHRLRSAEPFIVATVRKLRVQMQGKSIYVNVRDARVNDFVPSSDVREVVKSISSDTSVLQFQQTTVNNPPELRASVEISPLHLSIDQDTAEFIGRFLKDVERVSHHDVFSNIATDSDAKVGTDMDVHVDKTAKNIATAGAGTFIQRFEFCGADMVVDYIPKKVDYQNLRSGATGELLNVFSIKGSRLRLKPAVVYGCSGFPEVFDALGEVWAPDIRSTQVGGLVAGLAPVRRTLRVTKRVQRYTVNPVRHTQAAQGAGALVRRALDELVRIGQTWLDSSGEALGGA